MSRPERLAVFAVEDEALIAMELEGMLQDLGHEVIGPTATVATALSLLRSSVPDVAVIDANLGGVSAAPIVEALREREIPVILASGYETRELRQLGLEGHLVKKPYSARDLAKGIATVCCLPNA